MLLRRSTKAARSATFPGAAKHPWCWLQPPSAPPTPVPVVVKVMAQPVVEGRMGRMTPVKDLLLMVVAPAAASTRTALNPVEKTVAERDNRRVSPD